jgi:hypothetical protein
MEYDTYTLEYMDTDKIKRHSYDTFVANVPVIIPMQ